MKNRILFAFTVIIITAGAVFAQPTITPTYFLDTAEPVRMCQNYIDAVYGDTVMAFAQPSGGAFIRVDQGSKVRYVYFFCDAALNRIMAFSLDEDLFGQRTPVNLKAYGRQKPLSYFEVPINELGWQSGSISPPLQGPDSAEYFAGPVDVTVSSKGRFFDLADDRIYVLDQGNQRVVKFRYDITLDSLIWVSSFGPDVLEMPTALDYADYRTTQYSDDDIYVVDGIRSKIFRFSIDGVLETSFGTWGSTFGCIGYPTGIAVSRADSFPNRFYVTDSRNHRVVGYHSSTSGRIMAEYRYDFPLTEPTFIKSVDTDDNGDVYVLDSYKHRITALVPRLNSILLVYGSRGSAPGQFEYPEDIFIDKGELQVCERWGAATGIQSLAIQYGQPKQAAAEIPRRFYLYQNYPNPFNSTTIIKFDIPQTGAVQVAIYNILGQKVTTLVDNVLPPGTHTVTWDGRNSAGSRVSSGVYFYQVNTNTHRVSKKLLLLK